MLSGFPILVEAQVVALVKVCDVLPTLEYIYTETDSRGIR